MRKPDTIEWLYLDFDGFFASVEQQARPFLRGRPVGIVPFSGTVHTCVIACSKEAKARGLKNVMNLREAKRLCPDLLLVPQSPDLYRRAHNALLAEIAHIIPIDAVKSIDELTCRLQKRDIADPRALAAKIKRNIHENIGPYITCSIGFAANRHLAKIACKMDKPDGVTVWPPEIMPTPLLPLALGDIPGIGKRMERRLWDAGIYDMPSLLACAPKQLRKIWGNVTGERLWYALHGYALKAQKSVHGMFGHGRVLPPDWRDIKSAHACSRLLLVKAARRMRREKYCANALYLWLSLRAHHGFEKGWTSQTRLANASDDHSCLQALEILWREAETEIERPSNIVRLGVTLGRLAPANCHQLDLLISEDPQRQKWQAATRAMDSLNKRYGKSLVTIGPWVPPPGGYAGGKISFTRIPRAEDFW